MSYQEQQDAIKNKLTGVVNDVGDHVSNVADKASKEGAAAKREIVDAASDMASRATEALNDAGFDTDSVSKALRSSLGVVAANLRKSVRGRPLAALAVAAGIGLLLGAMSSR